jgi:GalNAc-alpha-(1->4)-GalNAc-alpha-(1->3)-diNAcBac-PP-undecaprenol alpha-1,4-N-acetyl-D-galactosaminyltransferase
MKRLAKLLAMNKVRQKLCLLIPTIQPGGMERVMSELAHFFCKEEGLEVHLVLYGRHIQQYYELPVNLIVHLPDFIFNDRLRIVSMVRRLFFLRRTVAEINPDRVLSFGEYWNSFVLLALRGLNLPVFVSDRCQPGKPMRLHHEWLRRALYPTAAGIVAQTSVARRIYSQQLKHGNVRVIGNPIRLPSSVNGEAKENVVLSVGRLIRSKNHKQLIELFAQIGRPDWKLVIVGGNALKMDMKKELVATIERLDVADKVVLTGSQSDVETYYRRSRIFAFMSESEGFPNVIGEAQSFGLPVIAFDCVAGPSDLITENYNGLLIPLHDYVAFRQKLTLLMESTGLRERLGANALESVRRYSAETIGRQFYDFVVG